MNENQFLLNVVKYPDGTTDYLVTNRRKTDIGRYNNVEKAFEAIRDGTGEMQVQIDYGFEESLCTREEELANSLLPCFGRERIF